MLNIVLVSPEIHQNTGNIARTCAATGARLHLIRPLGFEITDKALRRAGLDYWYLLDVNIYDSLEDFFEKVKPERFWLLSTKAPQKYTDALFQDEDYLFFGRESAGLPEPFLEQPPALNGSPFPARTGCRVSKSRPGLPPHSRSNSLPS